MGKLAAVRPEVRMKIEDDLRSGNFIQSEIAQRHKVSVGTVSKFNAQLKIARSDDSLIENRNLKRKRQETVLGLSDILLTWFLKARSLKIPILIVF